MLRNGWEMPSYRAAICTVEWMDSIRKGKQFCIRQDKCGNLKRCYADVPKAFLIHKIEAFVDSVNQGAEDIGQVRNLIAEMKVRSPDREWLLKLLALWMPDDEIFKTDYFYVKVKKITTAEVVYDNEDGFWDKLPDLSEKEIRGMNRLKVPKAERLALKLAAL
jgi:hypothetical protein